MITEIEVLAKHLRQNGPYSNFIETIEISKTHHQGVDYPLHSFVFGSPDPKAPTFFLVGGVHGLERIGAQLCFEYLKHLIERLFWDKVFQNMLTEIRFVFIPLLNPVGYIHSMRSNGNGVDLMRNSPIESEEKVPFLLGGHRFSNKIPWYRGEKGKFENENQFFVDIFNKHCSKSKCVVSLDFHSGFGLKDQLWFPHSYTKRPFDHLSEFHSFISLFEKTYPYHIYKIEPQSQVYHLHGDLWDYVYLEYKKLNPGVFLPITLEMGSWNWVKKNPLQLMSRGGLFNPVIDHRKRRTFRRHHLLLDFISRALVSNLAWVEIDQLGKLKHGSLARERWYEP